MNHIRKISCAIIGAAAFVSFVNDGRAQATYGNDKVFVCKYVGTPDVDERLQTGQNPILVSANAIPVHPVVIGSEFADAQGRSVVIAFDEGQPEPDVYTCPTPTGPTTTTTTLPPDELVNPPAPTPVDKCDNQLDGVDIPAADPRYAYYRMQPDGFYGDMLTPGYNAWTGIVVVSPAKGFLISGAIQQRWAFEYPNTGPCSTVSSSTVAPAPVSVEVTYECIMPSAVASERIGRVTAVIKTGSADVYGWSLTIDAIGMSKGHVGTEAIVFDVAHPVPGTYTWLAAVNLTPSKGAGVEGRFDVVGDCSPPEVAASPTTYVVGPPPTPPVTTVVLTTVPEVSTPPQAVRLPATGISMTFVVIAGCLVLMGFVLWRIGKPVHN